MIIVTPPGNDGAAQLFIGFLFLLEIAPILITSFL